MTRKQHFLSITKPSNLIKHALEDLIEVTNQGCKVNMEKWVHLDAAEVYVCMAGAVLVNTFKLPVTHQDLHPGGLSVPEKSLLYAVNHFRAGALTNAFKWLSMNLPECIRPRVITPYCIDQERFFNDMYNLILDLETIGM